MKCGELEQCLPKHDAGDFYVNAFSSLPEPRYSEQARITSKSLATLWIMPREFPIEYSHRAGFRVEVRKADALDLCADLLIFGRSPGLRGRLAALAGREFRPLEGFQSFRRAEVLRSTRLPWRVAVSYGYQERKARVEWPLESTAPPAAHILTLTSELFWLVRTAESGLTFPKRVVLLPLGWRYPEVSAAAWVAALWRYGEMAQRGVSTRTFVLADVRDPSGYLPLLNNHNGALYRMLRGWEMVDASYAHPFTRG
jgi:hypothetical protein